MFALFLVPDVTHDVVNHVHSETERFGKEGMDPEHVVQGWHEIFGNRTNSLSQPPSPPHTNKMFGSKILEQECREYLEQTFGVPFPTVRPDFLKRPITKRNLELDCYNAQLKLACEYQGPQHRVYLPLHHKFDIQNFYDQVERDRWKVERCRELGIDLIVVPDTLPRSEVKQFLHSELTRLGRI
jgi:hypothetical protein